MDNYDSLGIRLQKEELFSPLKSTLFHPGPSPKAEIPNPHASKDATGQNTLQTSDSPCSPDPTMCHISDRGGEEEQVAINETSTTTLHVVNSKRWPCQVPASSLTCVLLPELSDLRQQCTVTSVAKGQYRISYQSSMKGKHQLHIKVEDQHIHGSPFGLAVMASPSDIDFSTPLLTITGLEGPWGISLTSKGELVVSEEQKHQVSVFNPKGERIRSFGRYGSGKGQFENPCGVAVDGLGKILVVDHSNHRIQKFTAEGQFLAAVGTEGRGPLQFYYPIDVAISNSKVYVVDKYNHRIQVLNSDLSYFSTFGRKGSDVGQFSHPLGVFYASTEKLYVTDLDYHRVQVFTSEGKFLRVFGKNSLGWQGQMDWPNGIALDSNGVVYITESRSCRVSTYTSSGQYLASFGSRGEGPGQFNHPRGIAVHSSGVVYVCDRYNNRIQVF